MIWLTFAEYLSEMTTDMLRLSFSQSDPFLIYMTYHRVCNKRSTTGDTCGEETAYPSGASEFTLGF
jgi:hypothetical protein